MKHLVYFQDDTVCSFTSYIKALEFAKSTGKEYILLTRPVIKINLSSLFMNWFDKNII